jgi:hypothetical protein
MALSTDFQGSVSFLPGYPTYRTLTFVLVGSTSTEYTNLRWKYKDDAFPPESRIATRRKLLVTANRNAFYYGLDCSKRVLIRQAHVKQTSAGGLDDHGRPIRVPNTAPTIEGTVV